MMVEIDSGICARRGRIEFAGGRIFLVEGVGGIVVGMIGLIRMVMMVWRVGVELMVVLGSVGLLVVDIWGRWILAMIVLMMGMAVVVVAVAVGWMILVDEVILWVVGLLWIVLVVLF
jgi:hypothetical protein